MDSLRPDLDELDQFKNRKNNNKSTSTDGDAEGEAVKSSVKKLHGNGKAPIKKASNSPMILVFAVILMAVFGGLAWIVYQQQADIKLLKQNLQDASGFIGQSKLLMARFEGELNSTGAELEQSGSAAQKKLAFLDSEMRKLWGISNDRNKKAIKDNENAISGFTLNQRKTNESIESELLSLKESAQKKASESEKRNADIAAQLSSMASELVALKIEQEDALSSSKNTLKDLAANTGEIKLGFAALMPKVADNTKSIESIDASRRQINARVVNLERQLNKLQTKVFVESPSANNAK